MKKSEIDSSVVKPFFKGDLKGLLLACKPLKKFFTLKSLLLSIIAPTLLVLILMIKSVENVDLLNILTELSSLGSSIVGVLLGISLGGFILVVSYGNQDLIDKSIKSQANHYEKKKEMKFSYIQVSIAKYGLIVLLQFLVFALFLIFLIGLKINFKVDIMLAKVMNTGAIWILTFLLFYTMFLTYQLILNIFTLSQTSSANEFMEQFEDEEN